jgi:hypothetical protein
MCSIRLAIIHREVGNDLHIYVYIYAFIYMYTYIYSEEIRFSNPLLYCKLYLTKHHHHHKEENLSLLLIQNKSFNALPPLSIWIFFTLLIFYA